MKDGVKLNKESIKYGEYKLDFIRTNYVHGGTAILAFTDDGEYFTDISINLTSYGYYPNEDHIYLNHDLDEKLEALFRKHFVEETTDFHAGGWVLFELVRLKPELFETENDSEMNVFDKFVKHITRDDVDLIDKLDNMVDCEITGELAEYISENPRVFCAVENFVLRHVKEYEDFIVSETESLWEQELIESKNDFASGLYNCDDIYVRAILHSVGVKWLPTRL